MSLEASLEVLNEEASRIGCPGDRRPDAFGLAFGQHIEDRLPVAGEPYLYDPAPVRSRAEVKSRSAGPSSAKL